jgi:hypothetical protein
MFKGIAESALIMSFPRLAAVLSIYGILTTKGHRLLTSERVNGKRCSSRKFPTRLIYCESKHRR